MDNTRCICLANFSIARIFVGDDENEFEISLFRINNERNSNPIPNQTNPIGISVKFHDDIISI